ncbi:MAG: tetratricopeptide repeat protein [Singulisphaera sp.]
MPPRSHTPPRVERSRPRTELRAIAWPTFAAGAALALLVVAAYWPLGEAGFIWDDDSYVTANLTLHTVEGLRRIWCEIGAVPQYYPLVFTTFWLEYHLWGLTPQGYHVTNVILHALSVLLLWRLLVRLHVPGAWLAAALFAVHPVMVESVGWVTERKNVLSLALALASLYYYLRFAPLDDVVTGENDARAARSHWWWYALSLGLFLAALLSKTVVASLPAVILVLTWWKRGRVAPLDVARLLPFFALGIISGLSTAWLEKYHVGAAGVEWDFTPVERLLIAGRAAWFYAGKLAWPYPLAFFYPRFTIDESALWQYLFPLAALLLVIGLWAARGRVGRGPLAAVLIFGGVLVPALGFFDVYPMRFSFVADHFQYHASVALLALAAAGAATLTASLSESGRRLVVAGAAVVLAVLAGHTIERAYVFQNLERLYRDTIAKNPRGPTAYANLAVYLESVGRYDEALTIAREAVRLDPNEATAHNTLGICLIRLAASSENPAQQTSEGLAELNEALRLFPRYADAHVNLATALLATGQREQARQQLLDALQDDPLHAEAHNALGNLLAEDHDFRQAATQYEAAVAARPNFEKAWNNLGVCWMNLGETAQAIQCFQESLRQNPAYEDARANLVRAQRVRSTQSSTP